MAAAGWAFMGLSRFVAPDLGAAPERGPTLAPTGSIALVSGDDNVRQSILILLSSRPGERVMRPTYGCAIHRLVFSPNDATTAGLAIHYVRQALLRFEPRIDILRLDAGPTSGSADRADDAGVTLFISLDYLVRATRRAERLGFELDLSGERP